MENSEIVIELRHTPEYVRRTTFGTIRVRDEWHAEVVVGVPPSQAAGVDFYPYEDADTPDQALARLVRTLREEGWQSDIRVLGSRRSAVQHV